MIHNHVHVGQFSRLRPTVNFANRMTAFPGQIWGPRTIPDCQLLYVISGNAILTLGPQEFNLASGDCIFYGPDSPHSIQASKSDPVTFASIHYFWDHDCSEPMLPHSAILDCTAHDLNKPAQIYTVHVNGHGNVTFPHHFSTPNLESLFMQIVREYRFEEHAYDSVLRGLLTQLLVVILRYQINGHYSSAARRKIAPALEAIRKQPGISWNTAELANLCGYHPTYFASLFKDTTGHSPKHFLILERIRKAKHMLLEVDTIESVAYKLGYTSIHYFCRNFKAITGLTPTEFKQQSIEL